MTGTELSRTLARTVRRATTDDIDELAALCESTPASIEQLQQDGEFLVLDGPGYLAGTVYLCIDEPEARIQHLNVAPLFAESGLSDRLIAVAELVARASGCEHITRELPPTSYRLPASN